MLCAEESPSGSLKCQNASSRNLIMVAALYNNIEIFQELIELGYPISQDTCDSFAKFGQVKILKIA